MTSDELERHVLEAARDYHLPTEPPRDEMWAVIRRELPEAGARGRRARLRLAARRHALSARHRARSLVRRLPRWTPWAMGVAAAALMVGFGLGRLAAPLPIEESVVASPGPGAGSSLPVRLAAADHLGEAEALLTLYRTDRTDELEVTGRWARDLLATTRMLIDSRAGEDPEMAQLLGDLELILAQIASAAADPDHHEIIEDGIEERQLMAKLRSAASPMDISL